LGPYLIKLLAFFRPKSKKKIFSKTTRYAVKVKSSLGLWGVALLTPFLFTPILGSFLALAFKYKKSEIIVKMAICGILAGYIQTAALFYLKESISALF
jgi:hypothetical protein